MAESQEQYDYVTHGDAIELSISNERFSPYFLSAGHDVKRAFNLYLYNARLSKAFLFPLHALEVTLRNRMHTIFEGTFGHNWPSSTNFLALLTFESCNALDTGIRRANDKRSASTEDIVATLTFDFWSNLFRKEYDRTLWQTEMTDLLPNKSLSRHEFQNVIKNLNNFRNRVAHHEPIHTLNFSAYHAEILKVLGWMCTDTHSWVKMHSTVNSVMRTKPASTGEAKPLLGEKCDSDFSEVDSTSITLENLPSERFIICTNVDRLLEPQQIARYLLANASAGDLILELKNHTLDHVIQFLNIKKNYIECGDTESFIHAKKIFQKAKNDYIVVREANKGIVGVIAKPHRQH